MQRPRETVRHARELTLLWLVTRREGRGTASKLREALAPLLGGRLSKADLAAAVDEALAAGQESGELEHARGRLVLTDSGRKRVLETFELRAGAKLTWRGAKESVLPRHALGLATTGKVSAAALGTAILLRAHGLRPSNGETPAQARDRLAWKLLGADRSDAFKRDAVLAFLLAREVGFSNSTEAMLAIRRAAAATVGARGSDSSPLAAAVVGRWLWDEPLAPTAVPPPAKPSPNQPANGAGNGDGHKPWPEQPAQVAARILDAARGLQSGRFGDDKVFVSYLFRALHPPYTSLDRFKDELLKLHRERHLTLSRADLVEAMDPRDVAESEIRHHNATFHFVRLS